MVADGGNAAGNTVMCCIYSTVHKSRCPNGIVALTSSPLAGSHKMELLRGWVTMKKSYVKAAAMKRQPLTAVTAGKPVSGMPA